ncbi:hypothetical protein EMCRGX_G024032 [Ephydatia muelleri]
MAHDFQSNITHSSANSTYGVDISSPISETTFSCLIGDGFTFAIVRAYESSGTPDKNAPATIANARAAGMKYVDVYLFPCPKCSKTASQQVEEMMQSLKGSDYGMVWLDIEGSEYWLGSTSANQQFFKDLLTAAQAHKCVGVYSSESQWSEIFGDSFTGGSSRPLWYAHYDNSASFSDFKPFAGWSKPAMKQYVGDATVCGADVDKNWY